MTGPESITRFLMMLKLLLVLAAGLSACTPARPDTGILVIAVEGLKSEDLSCIEGQGSDLRGFNFLCQNFVNIQGVVANSSSNAANFATLLTGMPPAKHGLRINDQVLATEHLLLSERLVARGWRTSFFTGGAPLLRRTRLDQGFETFDESIPQSPKIPFRNFEATIQPFLNWVKESNGFRHLAFMSASEPLYPEFTSVSDKGETRPRSLEGQIDELDESIFHFFEETQKTNLWKKWWIVVVGLPGRSEALNRRPIALQINPTAMLMPLYLHPPESVAIAETRLSGVWSFTELGEFLQEIADDVDAPSPRTPEEQGKFFVQKWRDRAASYAAAEGCVLTEDRSVACRTAYFDETAWITWEAPLRLDAPGRKELLMKIQTNPEIAKPETPINPSFAKVDLDANLVCLAEFAKDTPNTAFVRLCPSKAIQSLRSLYQARMTSLARPETLRDQKLRFFHEWSQLASAHQLFLKYDPTRWYNQLASRPSAEFLTIQKILERPELRDLQKEAMRSLPSYGP